MAGRVIGYEVGGFENGKWIGFADCTPCPQPRDVVEKYAAEWNADPEKFPGAEFRVVEIREA